MSQSPFSYPRPERKRALIILNAQNDALFEDVGISLFQNRNSLLRINELIPYFRRDTHIIWVCKHMDPGLRFYQNGTFGAEISSVVLMDKAKDLIIIKPHSSGFHQTSLVMELWTKMALDVYIYGCWTNRDVYSTAAELVPHGMRVTVIEDYLRHESEGEHSEATRRMTEVFGVEVMDSEGVIIEYGGRAVPDMQ